MKNRSELREIIMKVIYQVNLLEEAKLEYDISELIKEQNEVQNDFVNTSVDGIIEHKKEIYDDKPGFDVYFDERYSSYAVRCSGKCNRNERPLSCRIFPYFFYLSEETENRIKVAPDIRAVDFCPILDNTDDVNKKFLRALRICALKIEQENEFRDYLFDITEIITDFGLLD